MNDSTEKHTPEAVEAFIARWQDTGHQRGFGRVLEFPQRHFPENLRASA